MITKCPTCRSTLPDEARFCPRCGKELSAWAASATGESERTAAEKLPADVAAELKSLQERRRKAESEKARIEQERKSRENELTAAEEGRRLLAQAQAEAERAEAELEAMRAAEDQSDQPDEGPSAKESESGKVHRGLFWLLSMVAVGLAVVFGKTGYPGIASGALVIALWLAVIAISKRAVAS